MTPPSSLPPPVRWVATCPTCARAWAADVASVRRYLRKGWPACCGRPLAFGLAPAPAADKPTASDPAS
jgi:hypothetical protein